MSKISLFTGLMLCASVVFIACDKKDDAGSEPARLLVANAVITPPASSTAPPTVGPSIDVRWNGQFIIPNVIYGAPSVTTGSPFTALGNAATPQSLFAGSYANVRPGAFGLNFAISGQGGANGLTVYDRTTSLLPGLSYTAIAFDFVPLYRVHIMEDDLSAPPAGKIKVRFIHAVPQAIFQGLGLPRRDTVDVTGFGGLSTAPLNNTALYTSRTFGDAFQNPALTRFAVIDSGSYRFGLRVAGTPGLSPATGALGLFPATGNPIRLLEGRIYTIIARMHPTTTTVTNLGQPGVTIIQHN